MNTLDLSTSSVRCSHFTLGNLKKIIFQRYYSYTTDYLRLLRSKRVATVVLLL